MKNIFFAFALALLLVATACNGLLGKKENPQNQSVENVQPNDEPDFSQDYFTMDEEHPTIVGEIRDGDLWLTFDKKQVLYLNITDEDSYRLPDGPVKVEGLNGAPSIFIIADIGQDYNPILCVKTSKKKVQLLNLWNTVATGDLKVTEIPMDGIVGFKAAPGGPWVDEEDGTVYYEYTTIYGLDTKNSMHEIPLYMLDNDIEYVERGQGGDVVFQLHLSDDWKMKYVIGYYLSEKVEEMQGRFWLINEDWDNMVFKFGYELTTDIDYMGDGPEEKAISQQGVFEIRRPNFDNDIHVVVPIEGIDFANKGMNIPVSFYPTGAYGG